LASAWRGRAAWTRRGGGRSAPGSTPRAAVAPLAPGASRPATAPRHGSGLCGLPSPFGRPPPGLQERLVPADHVGVLFCQGPHVGGEGFQVGRVEGHAAELQLHLAPAVGSELLCSANPSLLQKSSLGITSPPFRVIRARSVASSRVRLTNRTDPS